MITKRTTSLALCLLLAAGFCAITFRRKQPPPTFRTGAEIDALLARANTHTTGPSTPKAPPTSNAASDQRFSVAAFHQRFAGHISEEQESGITLKGDLRWKNVLATYEIPRYSPGRASIVFLLSDLKKMPDALPLLMSVSNDFARYASGNPDLHFEPAQIRDILSWPKPQVADFPTVQVVLGPSEVPERPGAWLFVFRAYPFNTP